MIEYNNYSDIELIDEIIKGDNSAFRYIIARYEGQIARVVKGMLGECAEAEDIGQETFIRFYKSINKFRNESQLGTYLTRIAINLSLNELKKRKKKQKIFSSDENKILKISSKEVNNDINEMVTIALQSLDVKYRSVIVMRMLQGYDTKETAQILKIPVGTVLSRLSRAQDKLRILLKDFL
ncbi:MAG: RNA polymerase sigma factor [Bacteroidales bacterium]|nr:RNA polymerase sigma factor [Bacteroidales bacterium]